jgi:hypothetical protein
MDKELILKERRHYTCDSCPFFLETGNEYDTPKVLDLNGRTRKLAPWSFYCQPAPHVCRKISHKADYTGNTPKWCPRLEANQCQN